jgi:DUF1680 family protein
MFLLHGDSKYIDLLEKVLYNGLISGVGLDGKSFFYTNAMQVTNGFTHSALEKGRSGWFECSCCPTNMVRFLPSLPGYIYAQKNDNIYVNLFIAGAADLKVNEKKIKIIQVNNYPWNGNLMFKVDPESPSGFNLRIRIPGWSRSKAIPSDLYSFENKSTSKIEIKLNGHSLKYHVEDGYAVINREWKKGDQVQVNLPMDVKKITANKTLVDDRNKIALQRGPIIYSAEWKDNNGKVSNLMIPDNAILKPQYEKDILNGVTVLKGEAIRRGSLKKGTKKVMLTAIPYYSWANRGPGEMTVWFPRAGTTHDGL